MTPRAHDGDGPIPSKINRRTALHSTLAAAGAVAVSSGELSAAAQVRHPQAWVLRPYPRRAVPPNLCMKKSINLWAFPYPQRMTLRECLQLAKDAGFDGIELNYDLENDLSPGRPPTDFRAIRKTAEEIGIAISGLCSFLYWPYSLTDNDPAPRPRPGAGPADDRGRPRAGDREPPDHRRLDVHPLAPRPRAGPIDVCDRRAKEAIGQLLPLAEKLGVSLNVETIWFNGYLTTPAEMNAFVDSFESKHVRVHFDTGNVMLFQFPEHWVPTWATDQERPLQGVLQEGVRPQSGIVPNAPVRNHELASRDGGARQLGYEGYVTWEYFHPFLHYPEALIH